jgi:hypothetical protein
MKNLAKTIAEKMLDLGNYLMTALLVAYFIEPNGESKQISFELGFIGILLIYLIPVAIWLVFRLIRLYIRR